MPRVPSFENQERRGLTLRTTAIVEPIELQITVDPSSPTEKLVTIQASEAGYFLLKVWIAGYPDPTLYDSLVFDEASVFDVATDSTGKHVFYLTRAADALVYQVCAVVINRIAEDGEDWEGLTRTVAIPEDATYVVYGGYLQGPAGAPGEDSIVGAQGERGLRGPAGIGPAGASGPVGPQGIQGIPGEQGEPSIIRGPQGIEGDQGEQGDAAATIEIGDIETLDAGHDATVTNSGTISAVVLEFGIPKGPRGLQGEQGEQGDQGDPGEGEQGLRGYPGDDGDNGANGTNGADGADGADGDDGDSATIALGSVGITTLDPGEDATVSITKTGVDPSATFSFVFGIPAGAGVIAGGTTSQFLAKSSDNDYETEWVAAPTGTVPDGTAAFQVLRWDDTVDAEGWVADDFLDVLNHEFAGFDNYDIGIWDSTSSSWVVEDIVTAFGYKLPGSNAGDILVWNGSAYESQNVGSGIADGDIIQWNGTAFEKLTPAAPVSVITSVQYDKSSYKLQVKYTAITALVAGSEDAAWSDFSGDATAVEETT